MSILDAGKSYSIPLYRQELSLILPQVTPTFSLPTPHSVAIRSVWTERIWHQVKKAWLRAERAGRLLSRLANPVNLDPMQWKHTCATTASFNDSSVPVTVIVIVTVLVFGAWATAEMDALKSSYFESPVTSRMGKRARLSLNPD